MLGSHPIQGIGLVRRQPEGEGGGGRRRRGEGEVGRGGRRYRRDSIIKPVPNTAAVLLEMLCKPLVTMRVYSSHYYALQYLYN